MAPKRAPLMQSSRYSIGDCEVAVDGKKFTCESGPKSLQIKFSRTDRVEISVLEEKNTESRNGMALVKCASTEDEQIVSDCLKEQMFLLLNPRDEDDFTKSHIQEVQKLYSKELPDMNYASNTGKQSAFLERCVSKGKYCSLILKSTLSGVSDEIIAAITYQIVPADTQYAEIPLAAVTHTHQNKGFGKLVYEELKKRLCNVGIRAIYCWADKESEGFWFKQGFIPIAEVDQKGKARKLHIKSSVRKALCFPGGSTLMLSHLKKESSLNPSNLEISSSGKFQCLTGIKDPVDSTRGNECNNRISDQATTTDNETKGSTPGLKRTWKASLSSLQSKRVKGIHRSDSEVDMDLTLSSIKEQKQSKVQGGSSKDHLPIIYKRTEDEQCIMASGMSESLINVEACPNGQLYRILLMDIGDENKRALLTEVIRKLGGSVTLNGSMSTHIVTGKVRKTLNFCTALCSGAWIVSPSWLKESLRQGRFANETSHILHDEDYKLKYQTDLKSTILRAKARPKSLLRGYDICIGRHVQLPIKTSTAIINSGGGNVIGRVDKVKDPRKAIYIGCEEDTEEAIFAAKKGFWTFSSEWLMDCVMKQQLDLQLPKFVESL